MLILKSLSWRSTQNSEMPDTIASRQVYGLEHGLENYSF